MPTAAKQPQDRKPKKKQPSQQRADVLDEPVTFTFDGEEWTVMPSSATSLEFLAALEDEEFIAAIRHLLGKDQAARLIRGRNLSHLEDFFTVMGEAVGMGNP